MPPVCLQIGTELIEPLDNVRNLGIIFDSQMSMAPHITGLCKSLSYQLRNISRIRRFLDQYSFHHIVRSLVLSRLDYGNALLLGINQTDLSKLQRLQNWAAKLIFCSKKQDYATPFMKELHWLPIKDRIHFKILLLCLSVSITLAHHILLQCYLFILLLASAYGLQKTPPGFREHKMYPRTLISVADRSFYSTAPKLWNILPPALRSSGSVTVFKKQLDLIFFHIDCFWMYFFFWIACCMYSLHHHKPCDLDGMAVYKSLVLLFTFFYLIFTYTMCLSEGRRQEIR